MENTTTTFNEANTPEDIGKPLDPIVEPAKTEEKKDESTVNMRTNEGKALVALSENGLPVPKNIEEEFRVADALLKGKGLPDWVKTSVQAFVVSQFCRALGFQPIVGVQFMQMVNGRLSLWGEGPLAAVRNSGQLESIEEFFSTKDYVKICWDNKNLDAEVEFAVCRVKRFGAPTKEFVFSAKDANQVKRGIEDIWKKWRPIMMKRKARAIALKDEFGDVLLGAPISEYTFHTAPDFEKDAPAAPKLEDRLNARATQEPTAAPVGQVQ